MFYKKFCKILSIIMCTAICAGSPATTSFAESLNPESVHLSKTSSRVFCIGRVRRVRKRS